MNRKLLFGVSGLVLIAITVLVLITSAYSVHQTKTAIVWYCQKCTRRIAGTIFKRNIVDRQWTACLSLVELR